jgi:L-Lysine epsilon oxidase N-terminal/L-lysine epsilon oxidase C-terminal domain
MRRVYRIHPAIGVARLGNSPDEYFVGPESPGVVPPLVAADAAPDRHPTRRDAQGRIKRQGQRFRIFEHTLDDAGEVTNSREITLDDADITWLVHLANRKAAARQFDGRGLRNPGVSPDTLVIDPGEKTVSGASAPLERLQGSFKDTPVVLGDLLTDSRGRLIVLGGFGSSASVPPGKPLSHYANNESWHDDVSDGPVRATLRLKGTSADVAVDSAWVIVAPPDYAPEIQNVITLWDVVVDMTTRLRSKPEVADESPVSFTRDIAPILRRVSMMHWVSAVAARGHAPRPHSRGYFLARMADLATNAPEPPDRPQPRQSVFKRLRNPSTGRGDMPLLPAKLEVDVAVTATLTSVQYAKMARWAQGDFTADWTGAEPLPIPYDDLPEAERPNALDRAPLEASVGAGRFPGIEAGAIMLKPSTYEPARPFRVNQNLRPGTLTEQMAVPWQADFRECEFQEDIGMDWWPGQRPCDVYRMVNGEVTRVPWVPQTKEWTAEETSRLAMRTHWFRLGFVLRTDVKGEEMFVEHERTLPD